MIFTHGINSILRAIFRWTKSDIPSDVSTRYNFKDGEGVVPAVPLDFISVKSAIDKCALRNTFYHKTEELNTQCSIFKCALRNTYTDQHENISVESCVTNVQFINME